MNIVFVCLTYGVGLPLLFFVSLTAFVILYLVERLAIFYYYKQPPMFGDEILNDALSILSFAPLFYMLFGFWMIGNKQIFSNLTFPIALANQPLLSGHIVSLNLTNMPYD